MELTKTIRKPGTRKLTKAQRDNLRSHRFIIFERSYNQFFRRMEYTLNLALARDDDNAYNRGKRLIHIFQALYAAEMESNGIRPYTKEAKEFRTAKLSFTIEDFQALPTYRRFCKA